MRAEVSLGLHDAPASNSAGGESVNEHVSKQRPGELKRSALEVLPGSNQRHSARLMPGLLRDHISCTEQTLQGPIYRLQIRAL